MEYSKYVSRNEASLKVSKECACIYCFRKYNPQLIKEWTDANLYGETNRTALCPFCGIDTVIPSSLVNYTDAHLTRWHQLGFAKN